MSSSVVRLASLHSESFCLQPKVHSHSASNGTGPIESLLLIIKSNSRTEREVDGMRRKDREDSKRSRME